MKTQLNSYIDCYSLDIFDLNELLEQTIIELEHLDVDEYDALSEPEQNALILKHEAKILESYLFVIENSKETMKDEIERAVARFMLIEEFSVFWFEWLFITYNSDENYISVKYSDESLEFADFVIFDKIFLDDWK